jgi:uncharacterized cupin superfamily protein
LRDVSDEARLADTAAGLAPVTGGWFVVNLRDAAWRRDHTFGADCRFESPAVRFAQFGINVQVLLPGQPNCRYHAESEQEALLVLQGECTLLIEEQERRLRAWDFAHLPPGTAHAVIGAGERPCAFLMVGARRPDDETVYPVSALALNHRAGVHVETRAPADAYADCPPPEPGRPAHWDHLPWTAT